MKFAAIDIGSNAVRLLLARVVEESDEPLFKKEVLIRMPLRLGDDAFRSGTISGESTTRLLQTMVGFKHLIAAYPAIDYAAYATSAMREAKNSREVVARVRQATGIAIEIIDGAREAEVIYANHVEHRLDRRKNYLYIDVGGGSTEVSLIVGGRMVRTGSFSVGTVRVLRGRPISDAMDSLKKWVKQGRREHGPMIAIGSGGNINTIFKLARGKQGRPLPFDTVREIRDLVWSFSLEERILELGMRPDRADVIGHASDIFVSVLKWGRIEKVFVPQVGLSDGMVHLLYERHRRRPRASAPRSPRSSRKK